MNENIKNKPTILVTTSTFPRYKDDSIPRFILDLCISLSLWVRVIVLAPHIPCAKEYERLEGIEVYRYRYLPERFESLVGEGGILSRIRANPLNILAIPFLLAAQYRAIEKVLKKESIDLIHAHWMFPQGVIVSKISDRLKIPFVVSSHGSDINQLDHWIFRRMYREVIRKAAGVTAVSKDLVKKIQKVFDREVSVIPMGIDEGFFEVSRMESGKKRIVSVGRLDRNKGFEDVMQVMNDLSEYTYTIIGEGGDREYYEYMIAKYSLEERVELIGSKSLREIQEIYQEASVCIVPSRSEGFGLVAVEAMAAGVPVIVNDISPLSDHVADSRGIAVDTTKPDLLIKAITNIRNIDTMKAREYVYIYRWEKIATEFREIYDKSY